MKKNGIVAKSGNLSGGGKSGVYKDFKDIYKILNLVQDLQNSEQTLQTSGQEATEVKRGTGNE
jgi:hypothetical protein